MTNTPQIIAILRPQGDREQIVPVVGWDDEGNALILDQKAGKRVRANQHPAFRGLGRRANWENAIPAAPGWTVRWCRKGEADIVDPVVGFLEDPSLSGGSPILADLRLGVVRDLRQMLPDRQGYRPLLLPPPGSHES